MCNPPPQLHGSPHQMRLHERHQQYHSNLTAAQYQKTCFQKPSQRTKTIATPKQRTTVHLALTENFQTTVVRIPRLGALCRRHGANRDVYSLYAAKKPQGAIDIGRGGFVAAAWALLAWTGTVRRWRFTDTLRRFKGTCTGHPKAVALDLTTGLWYWFCHRQEVYHTATVRISASVKWNTISNVLPACMPWSPPVPMCSRCSMFARASSCCLSCF